MTKQFGSQIDLQKIPVVGLVAEQKLTAPAAPVNGQLWFDTTANVLKVWEVNQWLLVANTAGGSTPAGPAGGDLTGSSYPNPVIAANAVTTLKIADLNVTLAKLAADTKDAAAATSSLRKLGTGATDAAAGNDSRFTDSRAPNGTAGGDLSGSYPNPGIAAGVIVLGDLNTTLTDGTAGSKQVRAIGATATDAAAGNHGHVLTGAEVTGTLPTSKGGTGIVTAPTPGAVAFGASATTYGFTAAGTAGQFLLSGAAATPTWGIPSLSVMAAPTADIAWNSKRITGLLDPANPQDAATKAYVDAAIQGLDVLASVRLATTAAGGNLTLTGAATIDGLAVATNDRILVKDQTTPAQNGVYIANTGGAWTRATDMDTWAEVPGAFTFVEQGTANADSGWVSTADAGGTIGTTAITWTQFSGAGSIIDGIGLLKTGNTLDVRLDNSSIEAPADILQVKALGITNAMLAGAIDLTTKVTNTLPTARGGTGIATNPTPGGVGYGASTSAQGYTTAGTAGQILHSGAAGSPTWAAVDLTSATQVTGALGVVNGGTGGATAAAARTGLSSTTNPLPQKFAGLAGALVAGVETLVTHNLGTKDIVPSFRDAATDRGIEFDWRAASTTQIGITTDVVGGYAANAIQVVVMG
jgi:hypothetical protein